MSDETPRNHVYLHAALDRLQATAGRELRFGREGIRLADYLGDQRSLDIEGYKVAVDPKAFLETVVPYRVSPEGEVQFEGVHGEFSYALDGDDLVLKPKRARAICVERVIEPDADDLARLRSLYRRGGMDLFIFCEGDTRARELAIAISAERLAVGLPTTLSLDAPGRYAFGNSPRRPADLVDPFDPVSVESVGAQPWDVRQSSKADAIDAFLNPADAPSATVHVVADRIYVLERTFNAMRNDKDERQRPFALMCVTLENSKPVVKITFSASLQQDLSTEPSFVEAPWDVIRERLAKFRASRTVVERTWHQTTDQVARAFIARKAPRGYVSNKSIFFHGPIAFCRYDTAPIAAIVDMPDGAPALFIGRTGNAGGTFAGNISTSQGDIQEAVRDKKWELFHVDDLTDFIKIGDREINTVAGEMRYRKNEASFPTTCAIDPVRLGIWLEKSHATCLAEIERAGRTSFPTYTKAQASAALGHLIEKRDRLADAFGFDDLPDFGPADEHFAAAAEHRKAADERQKILDARRGEKLAAARSARGVTHQPSAAPAM